MSKVILDNNTEFEGESIGVSGEVKAKLAVDSSMCGFIESICDQRFKGKILVFTYPIVNGYGVSQEQLDNAKPVVAGIIVHESCKHPSHVECVATFDEFLKKNNLVGIEGVDTRAITKLYASGAVKKATIQA